MRAFLLSIVATVALSFGAYVVLQGVGLSTAEQASRETVRLTD
ncbi:MAG: hypothetical protein ACFBRM_08735 [Pikeienuella sp.]